MKQFFLSALLLLLFVLGTPAVELLIAPEPVIWALYGATFGGLLGRMS